MPETASTTSEAKAEKSMPRNVLVSDHPTDTMLNCAAVLTYLDAHNPDNELDYVNPVYCLGRSLVYRTLIQALEAH